MLHFAMETHEADHVAALTLESLRRLRLPAVPASYTLLFVHHAGHSPELSLEVTNMMANPASATTLLCAQIHDRYFGSEHLLTSLGEVVAGMARPVDAISRLLSRTAHHTSTFEEIGSGLAEAVRMASGPCKTLLERAIEQLSGLRSQTAELRSEIGVQVDQTVQSLAKARRQFETEHTAARTDPLTRIGNRRRLQEAMAANQDGALILADIDHFKRFNDTHGHKAGDLVLMAFSRILRQVAGIHGTAVRFGGEEFVIFLPSTPLPEAVRLADRARAMLEHMANITTKSGTTLSKVTASFGVAVSRFGDRPEKLIERADRALYKAKKAGRNRVASEETSTG